MREHTKDNLEKLYNAIVDRKNVPNKESKKEWGKDLSDFLIQNKDKFITAVQPGGNNGDYLIYKGLNKRLKQLGIQYRDGVSKTAGRKNIILIQGGGNMGDLWGNGVSLLRKMISGYTYPIIVAPQSYYFTVTNFSDVFKGVKREIHLFCRERSSYSILKKMQLPSNVKIHVSDDTAFYMTKEDFADISPHQIEGKEGKEYVLLCFRTDKESSLGDLGNMRSKITDIFQKILGDTNVGIVEKDISISIPFNDFVGYVKGAKVVVTDRLHVSILASILEKPVILFSNSYFKSKAVYEYSLKHFPYTKFVDSSLIVNEMVDQ
jgi:exopolysaccharide biosynthesis predicted pyruvyltransferase EpsI